MITHQLEKYALISRLFVSGTVCELYKNTTLRGWRDASEGKGLAALPGYLDWLPSTHVMAHNM